MEERTVVVCLGNLYMRDDGLGIEAARALRKIDLGDRVSVQEHPEMDLTLIERLQGASRVIVVEKAWNCFQVHTNSSQRRTH